MFEDRHGNMETHRDRCKKRNTIIGDDDYSE